MSERHVFEFVSDLWRMVLTVELQTYAGRANVTFVVILTVMSFVEGFLQFLVGTIATIIARVARVRSSGFLVPGERSRLKMILLLFALFLGSLATVSVIERPKAAGVGTSTPTPPRAPPSLDFHGAEKD